MYAHPRVCLQLLPRRSRLSQLAENSHRLAPGCLTLSRQRLACSVQILIFFLGPRLVRTANSFILSPLNSGLFSIFPLTVYKLLKPQSTILGIIEGWDSRKAFM